MTEEKKDNPKENYKTDFRQETLFKMADNNLKRQIPGIAEYHRNKKTVW